jgi:cytochrome c peroxidase
MWRSSKENPPSWRRAARGLLLGLGLALLRLHPAFAAGGQALTGEQVRQVLDFFTGEPAAADETNRFERDPRAAELGRALFFNGRLSLSGKMSCASCHQSDANWIDSRGHSDGKAGSQRDAPALWNVSSRRWLLWDGRAASVWAQALLPIEAANEMHSDRRRLFDLIVSDFVLRQLYEKTFGPPPPRRDCARIGNTAKRQACETRQHQEIDRVFANVGKAIAAFEATITARSSPFDKYLECLRTSPPGACRQLSARAVEGLVLFTGKAGCVNCHFGPDLTDEEFHDIQLPDHYGRLDYDPGRMKGIVNAKADTFGPGGRFSDCPNCGRARLLAASVETPESFHSFRTPSLRQVAETAPYMHTGVYGDLRQVLKHYSTLADSPPGGHSPETILHRLNLSEDDTRSLIAFLCALTSDEGQVMGQKVAIPRSAASRRQCE